MANRLALLALLGGIGALGLPGCPDDTPADGADARTEVGRRDDARVRPDAEVAPTCDPPCDPNACEQCVDGTCTTTCTGDTVCDGAGNCIAPRTSAIGEPCTSDTDCEEGYCLTEYRAGTPGGYCTMECGPRDPCPEGNLCVLAGQVRFCARQCDRETDCREGYTCLALEHDNVCWADCDSDEQCRSTGHCQVGAHGLGVCTCPPGQHLDEDATACVYDTCEYLDCESRHMTCNPTGGCGGLCATCDRCEPPNYVESTNHCYPPGARWGSPCEVDADCPGTGMPGRDTFCHPAGGGNCVQVNGPDFVEMGRPCRGDPGSVGIVMSDRAGNTYEVCLASCSANTDCIPGLSCMSHREIRFCVPVTDCATSGCNDPESTLYCAPNGSCYVDGCSGDPCASVAHASGECLRILNDPFCVCHEGYAWNGETGVCEPFTCPATDIAVGSTTSDQDLCDGTTDYDAAGDGSSCTGHPTTANELVYRLVVPASSQVEITMRATTFDASLWVTTNCADRFGAMCVVGADREVRGAETVTVQNFETTPRTYYVVADSYQGCDTFSLRVSAATPVPCGNGTLQTGEACDDGNTASGDGCTNRCEIEFGYACTGAGAGSCSAIPSIGTFEPGAPIPEQTGGPIAAGASVSHMISFTGEVLLDGSVVAAAGNPDVRIVAPTGILFSHLASGTTEAWSGDRLSAGTYEIRITASGTTAIPSYTLNLTTAAP